MPTPNKPKPTPKPIKLIGSVAKVLKPIKAAPMTPEDAAMIRLLRKRYPDIYKK